MANDNPAPGRRTRSRSAKADLVGPKAKAASVALAAPAGDRLDPSALQHVVGFLIAMADVPARRVFRHHIGSPYGLREVEFALLVLLQANHGAAPKQLALSLNLPAPHVTLLLDRMTGRSLVERRRSPTDGRAVQVHLTTQGETLARQAHQASLTMEAELLRALSPAERAMLRELLIKLAGVQA